MRRIALLYAIAWLILAAGCVRVPTTGVTSIKAATSSELRGYLLSHKADVDQFRLRGPFAVTTHENRELRLSETERINTDLFLSAAPDKAPLVIFLHGYANSKEDHSFQAMHVASWGGHGMTLQLPNNGPWLTNGRTLAKIVHHINRRPDAIDPRVDASRIVLVGHSFGGSSVAIALAEGAPAAGAVLLDPAGVGRDLPKYLERIKVPVVVLGADEHVSATRNRGYFFRFMRVGVAEISIRDATHEDAQYPSDASSSEASQISFVSALTSAAFSLSATGRLDYAWTSFGEALENGRFFNGRRK